MKPTLSRTALLEQRPLPPRIRIRWIWRLQTGYSRRSEPAVFGAAILYGLQRRYGMGFEEIAFSQGSASSMPSRIYGGERAGDVVLAHAARQPLRAAEHDFHRAHARCQQWLGNDNSSCAHSVLQSEMTIKRGNGSLARSKCDRAIGLRTAPSKRPERRAYDSLLSVSPSQGETFCELS